MSADYYIYVKDLDRVSVPGFESYCLSQGLTVRIDPEESFWDRNDFVSVEILSIKAAGEASFPLSSGFELYCFPYEHKKEATQKRPGLFQKLLGKKVPEETPFSLAVKDMALCISLGCHSAEPYSITLAYALGAYILKTCGGVFDDPQTGQFYDGYHLLETEIAASMEGDPL